MASPLLRPNDIVYLSAFDRVVVRPSPVEPVEPAPREDDCDRDLLRAEVSLWRADRRWKRCLDELHRALQETSPPDKELYSVEELREMEDGMRCYRDHLAHAVWECRNFLMFHS